MSENIMNFIPVLFFGVFGLWWIGYLPAYLSFISYQVIEWDGLARFRQSILFGASVQGLFALSCVVGFLFGDQIRWDENLQYGTICFASAAGSLFCQWHVLILLILGSSCWKHPLMHTATIFVAAMASVVSISVIATFRMLVRIETLDGIVVFLSIFCALLATCVLFGVTRTDNPGRIPLLKRPSVISYRTALAFTVCWFVSGVVFISVVF